MIERFDREVELPGSKSITHRALLLGTLAEGESNIQRAGISNDTDATAVALAGLGARISMQADAIRIQGTGGRLATPSHPLQAGQSGTTARFLVAMGTLTEGTVVQAQGRMRQRPIAELVDALRGLGARIDYLASPDGFPLRVEGPLLGGEIEVDATRSSQILSAILLVVPYAKRQVRLRVRPGLVSRPYVETTLAMMAAFGIEVERATGDMLVVKGGGGYLPQDWMVEADASAAVYPLVAAAITGGATRVQGIPLDSRQADLAALAVLEQMGCRVERGEDWIRLESTSRLRGFETSLTNAPDAVPALAVAALFATGVSRIRGVGHLRYKESNRLAVLVSELGKLGSSIAVEADDLIIHPAELHPAQLQPSGDHRLTMAFELIRLRLPGVGIADPRSVEKSWPGFRVGMGFAPELVIAIDGPSGGGKSSVSRQVAAALEVAHLETGAFYRLATLAAIRHHSDPSDESAVMTAVADSSLLVGEGVAYLDGEEVGGELRSEGVNAAVSMVSTHPRIRQHMVRLQRAWVSTHGRRAVVEGRDIGTVVFPDAVTKVYLTASQHARAARRALEQAGREENVTSLAERDRIDSTRALAPLQPADDAVVIDTSELSLEQVVQQVLSLIEAGRSIPRSS